MSKPQSAHPLPEHAKKVFSGLIFDVYQWEQELFDGSTATFEKLVRPDTAIVIPITEDGRLILTEQEQPGRKTFRGFPGGRVEKGELPEVAAQRELLEETGYEAREIVLIDAQQPVTKIEWTVYTYVARGCRKVAEQNLDKGERVSLLPVTFEEYLEEARKETFRDSELGRLVLEAHYDPEKKEEFRRLLFGS